MYLTIKLMYFIVTVMLYEFVHDGHCNGGWDGSNTIQKTVPDCRNECAKRPDIGFFALSSSGTCACYFSKDGCPDDNLHDDHNAYRIVYKGDPLHNKRDSLIDIHIKSTLKLRK